MLEWVRQYGPIIMVTGGLAAYLGMLALDVLAGWRLTYPNSIAWLFLTGIPAAGLALMFHEVLLARAAEKASEQQDEPGQQDREDA